MEYGLIAALVALALLGGLKALGADLAGLPLQSIIDAMTSVT
jgi:Flp pilus assembly pilin Flp